MSLSREMQLDITDGFVPIKYPAISNQICYNLFEYEGAMIPTPGYEKLYSVGNVQGARGIFYSDILESCIVVIGDSIFKLTTSSFIKIGTLKTLSGYVYFAENAKTTSPNSDTGDAGGQIAITDGQDIAVYTLDGNLTFAVNDSGDRLDFVPGVLTFQDDYFFCNDQSSNKIYQSTINDAISWPADAYSTISSKTTACTAFERMLLVFGKDLTAVFYDKEDVPFAYQQDVSRAWEYGCSAPSTLANASSNLVWLSSNKFSKPIILHSTGGEPKKISNAGIDSILETFSKPNDSEGFIYTLNGRTFYQINFLTNNRSFLYDFETKKWYGISEFNETNHHNIRKTAFYEEGNEMIGISNKDSNIYKISANIFTQNDKLIPRTIITKNYTNNEMPFCINRLDVQVEQGSNQNPSNVMLALSKDRGRTYNITKLKKLANIGSRKEVLRFRQLGMARWWTFKLSFYSKDRFVILNATVWITK